jgi:hypothetical protein
MGCSASALNANAVNSPGAAPTRPVNVAPVREITMVRFLRLAGVLYLCQWVILIGGAPSSKS